MITIISQGRTIKIGIITIEKTAIISINSGLRIGLLLLIAIAWKKITPIKAKVGAENLIQRIKKIKKENTRSKLN